MYNTLTLENAVRSIATEREARLARQAVVPVLDDEHRRLFAKMGRIAPSQAKGLSYCIEPAERGLLADYLFTEAADEEKETLSYTLLEDMDPEGVTSLFERCLDNYKDEKFYPLFRRLSTDKTFLEAMEHTYEFRPEPYLEAMGKGNLVEYISAEAGLIASEAGGYMNALARFAVKEDTQLYRECAALYVIVCDAKEYRRLGVNKLTDMTSDFNTDNRTRLLRNMLNVMDDFQLQAFVPMLEDFISLTGEKGSGQYKEALGGVSKSNLDKYELWTSKYKIRKILGDDAISKFWYDFTGEASVIGVDRLDLIEFDFGSFVVLEIANNEVAYFYDIKYFRDHVLTGINEAKNAAELEIWLRDKTEWSASGEHQKHWRKAHKGQWQLAFREYIGQNR